MGRGAASEYGGTQEILFARMAAVCRISDQASALNEDRARVQIESVPKADRD